MGRNRHNVMIGVVSVMLAGGVFGVGGAEKTASRSASVQSLAKADDVAFERDVRPLLKKYCYECHDETGAGGLAMDSFKNVADLRAGKKEWEKVLRYARSHVMPPTDAEVLLGNEDREKLVRGVRDYLYGLEDGRIDPGRVVVRRLNRVEYRNSVRDLLGVDTDPTVDFPEDDTGYGFDNIGDVLTLPPMLMEKYLTAAERVAGAAVPTAAKKGAKRVAFDGDGRVLSSADEGAVSVGVDGAGVGEYVVRVLAYAKGERSEGRGQRSGGEKAEDRSQKTGLRSQKSEVGRTGGVAATTTSASRVRPSPLPTPGVPGEGERKSAATRATTRPEKTSVRLSLMVGDVVGREVEVLPGAARWYEGRVSVGGGKGRVKAAVRRVRGPAGDRVVTGGRVGEEQGGVVVVKEMVVEGPVRGQVRRVASTDLRISGDGGTRVENAVALISNAGEARAGVEVAHAGEYVLRVAACGTFTDDEPVRMEVLVDKKRVGVAEVRSPWTYQGKVQGLQEGARRAVWGVYETRVHLYGGQRRVSVRMLNDEYLEDSKDPPFRDRNLYVSYVELVDPSAAVVGPGYAGRVRELLAEYGGDAVAKGEAEPTGEKARSIARGALGEFARRAWRRPVSEDELGGVMKLYDVGAADGGGFRGGLKQAMTGVLVSPSFLMRGVPTVAEKAEHGAHPVGEFELAERLSYFLWSSTPDEELMGLAAKGELRKNLGAQVKRMLASPKASALSEQFGGQWLQFRNLDAAHPDRKMFQAYDDSIRDLMKKETQAFFESIVKDDRSVIDLLTADYTFVNDKLAKYYGIDGVTGGQFRRVSLEGTKRRGILTQGSVLTITSNPTRTSPVKRGKWVLENLLGAEPPAPPPNLPTLESAKVITGTLRQRLERHRADPSCAACHAAMDPIGLGLENFDAVGRWRETDAGEKIDAKSAFAGGKPFEGASQLVDILVKDRKDDVMRAAAEKMLTFAIGRGVEGEDGPAVDRIVEQMRKDDGRMSALVTGVVDSAPFQMRRGGGSGSAAEDAVGAAAKDQEPRSKNQTNTKDQIPMARGGTS